MKPFRTILLLMVLSAGARAADYSSNQEAWWKVDEGTGTTATDSSGNARNGTLTNGPTYAAGQIGPFCLSFDGSDDVIVLPGTVPATGTTYTIAFWIKPNSPSLTSASIFSNAGGTAGLFLYGSAAGSLSRKLDLYFSGDHVVSTALPDATWSHVVMSVSSGTVTTYVNGVSNGSATGATTFTPGKIGDDNANEAFKGSLDDIRYYSRALSSADAAALYAYRPAHAGIYYYSLIGQQQ